MTGLLSVREMVWSDLEDVWLENERKFRQALKAYDEELRQQEIMREYISKYPQALRPSWP